MAGGERREEAVRSLSPLSAEAAPESDAHARAHARARRAFAPASAMDARVCGDRGLGGRLRL